MKKKFAAIATAAALAASGVIYPTTCIVTETDDAADLVTISTCTGFTYQFSGVEDYMTGDLVSVLMFNNFTDEITDDVILAEQYSGVTEFFDQIARPER